MHNASIYSDVFLSLLQEDCVAGEGGVFGDTSPVYSPDNITSSDTYARGDARNIFGPKSKFLIHKRNTIKRLSKKSKKSKKI